MADRKEDGNDKEKREPPKIPVSKSSPMLTTPPSQTTQTHTTQTQVFQLEIPEDVLEAGGAAGVSSTEVMFEVPEEDPYEDPERAEAERHQKRETYITSQSDSTLQKLPPIQKQFPPIGPIKTVSQSQEVSKDAKGKDDKDDEGKASSEESDDGLYMIMFGPDKKGKYEPRYFDEDGYHILDLTSRKLQINKKKRKSGGRKKRESVEARADDAPQQQEATRASQEIIIPFKLDVNKPPPPPSAPISQAYDWWIQKGAAMFSHLQEALQPTDPTEKSTAPTTAPSASTNIPSAETVQKDKTKSAPSIVQGDVKPKTHRYSLTRPQPKDRPKPKDTAQTKHVPAQEATPKKSPVGKEKSKIPVASKDKGQQASKKTEGHTVRSQGTLQSKDAAAKTRSQTSAAQSRSGSSADQKKKESPKKEESETDDSAGKTKKPDSKRSPKKKGDK